MKIRNIITLAFLIAETTLSAQDESQYIDDRPRNNAYFNAVGGDGSVFSVYYERLFLIRPKFFLAGGLGIGFNKLDALDINISEPTVDFKYLIIPHHITMNLGKSKNFFEFGIGGTGIIGDVNQNYYLYPIIGYRFHPLESKKLNFRLYAGYPFYGWENMDIWWFPIGISVGVGF